MTYIPTEDDKKTIRKMASCALNLETIAARIGVTAKTLRVNPEMHAIYTEEYSKVLEEIAASSLNRARSGNAEDNALRIFFLKTKARWKDHSYLSAKDFKGSFSEKKGKLDEMLADGDLSIENYQRLSSSITEQYKVDEYETRLRAVEDIIKTGNKNINTGEINAKNSNKIEESSPAV